jgi:hypothetical protein
MTPLTLTSFIFSCLSLNLLTKASKIEENNPMLRAILFYFLFSAPLLAITIKVSLYGPAPGSAFAGNTVAAPLSMITEFSGDAASSSSPVTVYIPYIVTPANEDFLGVNDASMAPRLSVSNAQVYFRNGLTLTNEGPDTLNLYVASSLGSGIYKVVKAITTVPSTTTIDVGTTVTLDNSLPSESVCNQAGSTFCNNSTIDSFTSEVPLFYFLDKNVIARDAVVTTSSYQGVYYKLKISANVPTGSITFSQLRTGDSELRVHFDANSISQMGADLYQTLFFNMVNASVGPIGGLVPGSLNNHTVNIFKRIEGKAGGEIDVTDLTNSTTYNIAIALMNKYQFVSNVTVSKSGTPLKIDELLKSQACFLLTAGFGEEHWVIDYFKHIRDHFLAKFSAGRWFIGAYYETAPKYALKIYHSPSLRLMIRSIAYVAYSFIHYFYLYFAVVALGLTILLRRRSSQPLK